MTQKNRIIRWSTATTAEREASRLHHARKHPHKPSAWNITRGRVLTEFVCRENRSEPTGFHPSSTFFCSPSFLASSLCFGKHVCPTRIPPCMCTRGISRALVHKPQPTASRRSSCLQYRKRGLYSDVRKPCPRAARGYGVNYQCLHPT